MIASKADSQKGQSSQNIQKPQRSQKCRRESNHIQNQKSQLHQMGSTWKMNQSTRSQRKKK